jgi:hypothetical protein
MGAKIAIHRRPDLTIILESEARALIAATGTDVESTALPEAV